MSLREELIDLDTAVNRLSQGVNAVGLMSMGLLQARDPYADGLDLLYNCMAEADREVRLRLNACLDTV
ncbi:hypothetical protein D7V91_08680 [bacterium 1xD42-67]|nr:hypothetical protein D7V91_08680 [bacterium 1xD42-67]